MNMLEVRDEIKKLWPALRHIWPWDTKYEPFELDELKEISNIIRLAKITFPDGTTVTFGELQDMGEVWDCDDDACGAEFLVKLWHRIQTLKRDDKKISKPYGQARGSQFKFISGLHAVNIALTKEGIYFNDHWDRGRIWKANPDGDSLFYVSV